jgi:mono/diheme cytochrome c family protein
MHGKGTFRDPRLGIDIRNDPDRVTPVLAALREYQLSLAIPAPPPGSFDVAAAGRGRVLFAGKARCASCHFPDDHFTDVNRQRLHAPAETGMDPAYAARTVTRRYRTTPLRALWQHAPYFHDGSAATLEAVVEHYDGVRSLGLTPAEKGDLVEYLKSL